MSIPVIDVIIPAFNEEEAVGHVVADIPKKLVRNIVVVNNASSDDTRARAEEAGAIVVDQPERGYGNACLKGMEFVGSTEPLPDLVVFIDADHSDHPEEMGKVVEPIITQNMDMVIGSRALGNREKGAMTIPQVFGNWLSTNLLKLLYGVTYTDLGPFRAIKWKALEQLAMQDKNYGWTVEMQLKAAKHGLATCEVPVDYRKRIGFSKISGTIKGAILAGYKILKTILIYR